MDFHVLNDSVPVRFCGWQDLYFPLSAESARDFACRALVFLYFHLLHQTNARKYERAFNQCLLWKYECKCKVYISGYNIWCDYALYPLCNTVRALYFTNYYGMCVCQIDMLLSCPCGRVIAKLRALHCKAFFRVYLFECVFCPTVGHARDDALINSEDRYTV